MNSSKSPLAIFTPIVGRWAHEFVKAHIESILPGRTVVVAVCSVKTSLSRWDVAVPRLCVSTDLDPGEPSASTESTVFDSLPREARERFSSPPFLERVEEFLRDHGVEVVLAQWMHPSLPMAGLARKMGLRYYCQTHGTDITDGLKNPSVRRAYLGYNDTEGVVAPSQFGRRQLIDLGIRPERAYCVRHPVGIPSGPVTRASDPLRCLVVGRMEPMKNPLLIIEAFRLASNACPGLHLDYVGDGSLRPAVERAVAGAGLTPFVTFHGYIRNEQVRSMMRRNHIFLHPSQVGGGYRYDTCPVAVAEAMAESMAIVATRHGGIPEEIEDGETGLLVGEGDTQATAARIIELAQDAGLRTRLGEAARLRAQALFSASVVRRGWLELMRLSNQADA